MKKLILLFVIYCALLIPSTRDCFGQSITWQRNYNSIYSVTEVGEDVCSDGGENFYVVGTIDMSQGPDLIWVLKINKFGDTIWTRQIAPGWGRAIVSSGDGGCVLTGVRNEAFTVKLDSLGNISWDNTYTANIVYVGRDIIRTTDGGFIGCGIAYYNMGYIFKIDASGNLEWDSLYSGGYVKSFNKIVNAFGGGFVLVGITRITEFDTARGLISKIDSSGNTVWEQSFIVNDGSTGAYGLDIVNNTYIVCGQRYNGNDFKVFLKRFDISGKDLFTKVFQSNDDEYSSQVRIITSNKYVMSVTKTTTSVPYKDYVKLFYVDSLGLITGERTFDAPGDLIIKSILPINNRDILFVGYAEYSINARTDVYVLRTDSLLYAPPPIGLIKNSNRVPDKFVLYQNYPNPFNSGTIIQFKIKNNAYVELEIYDVTGREILQLTEFKQAGSYSYTFDGTNYASGLYFYKIQVRPAGSSTGTFVETKKMVLIK